MKSLQEIIEGTKDKELADLIKKAENSYILKGLDWLDKKSMLKKYFPDSKVAKGFDYLRDLIFYGNLGLIPGDKQEKYTEHLGYEKTKFTKNSLVYGFFLGSFKLGLALLSPVPAVSLGFYLMAAFTLTDDTARLTYFLITKKPVGTSYVEVPYRLGKHLLKKKKEKSKSTKTEAKSLNSSKFLDLS